MIKVRLLSDIQNEKIFSPLKGMKLEYVTNSATLEEDRRLQTVHSITLPKTAKLDILFFRSEEYIHNETAYMQIGCKNHQHLIATIEMLIATIPLIRKKRKNGLLSPKVKLIVALGTLVTDPVANRRGVCAYSCTEERLCLLDPMTNWKSPWDSKEVGYLVQKI